MKRLRRELVFLCAGLVLWQSASHANRLQWLLAVGTLIGWLSALLLTARRPWDPPGSWFDR